MRKASCWSCFCSGLRRRGGVATGAGRVTPGGQRPVWQELGEVALCGEAQGLGRAQCQVRCVGVQGPGRLWAWWYRWWGLGFQLCAEGGLEAGRS